MCFFCFFFSSRRRHTRLQGDWSSDVCSSDLTVVIRSVAGPRLKLEKLEIAGPAPDAAYLAAGGFPGKLSRAELAAAVPAEIGRASCREGEYVAGGGGRLKRRKVT